MKLFYEIMGLIVFAILIICVHTKADIRLVIEAGVVYLATVIRSTHEDK